jgi:CO dehydrogenase maturation factor
LHEVLGLTVSGTISEVMAQTKDPRAVPEGMTKEMFVQYKLNQSLTETKEVDLLVMGGPQGPGCYCYPNDLLRKHLEILEENYDYMIIDNEAGMEHISRQIINNVDILFIISDQSARGIRSAGRVYELAKSLTTTVKAIYLVVTKTTGPLTSLQAEIEATGLSLIGTVPYDEMVADLDLNGRPLAQLNADSVAVKAVYDVLQRAKI